MFSRKRFLRTNTYIQNQGFYKEIIAFIKQSKIKSPPQALLTKNKHTTSQVFYQKHNSYEDIIKEVTASPPQALFINKVYSKTWLLCETSPLRKIIKEVTNNSAAGAF